MSTSATVKEEIRYPSIHPHPNSKLSIQLHRLHLPLLAVAGGLFRSASLYICYIVKWFNCLASHQKSFILVSASFFGSFQCAVPCSELCLPINIAVVFLACSLFNPTERPNPTTLNLKRFCFQLPTLYILCIN